MTLDAQIATARRAVDAAEKALLEALTKDRSRQRAALVRQLHEVRQMRGPQYPYVSQAGQDFVIDRVFHGRRNGTFADIGGYDGVTGSNTLYFEARRGWSGILVEPVPAQREKAEVDRFCPCLPYAIAADDGEAEFLEISEGYTQMSGLRGSYDPGLLAQVRADPRHVEQKLTVETRTLSRLLDEADLTDCDFVSLDIEGGEVSVLTGFPFDRHRIVAWSIENNTADQRIGEAMQGAGYKLVEFCGPDEVWVRPDLIPSR